MTEIAAIPEDTAGKRKRIRPVLVELGIYRHPNERTYHERPTINGKRTWRSLGMNFTPQHNLAAARDEFRRRRAMQAEGKDPYAPPKPEKKGGEAKTVGDLIRRYSGGGYLDKHLLERPDSTKDDEKRNCDTLLLFWGSVPIDDVEDRLCDDYREQRVKNARQGEGLRTTDRELNTLNNVFKYCKL